MPMTPNRYEIPLAIDGDLVASTPHGKCPGDLLEVRVARCGPNRSMIRLFRIDLALAEQPDRGLVAKRRFLTFPPNEARFLVETLQRLLDGERD